MKRKNKTIKTIEQFDCEYKPDLNKHNSSDEINRQKQLFFNSKTEISEVFLNSIKVSLNASMR